MDIAMLRQVASFIGALLILIAYAGHQLGWMDPRKPSYNILNAAGSIILAYVAFHPFQIGFVVLEVTWTLISNYALLRPKHNNLRNFRDMKDDVRRKQHEVRKTRRAPTNQLNRYGKCFKSDFQSASRAGAYPSYFVNRTS